jgi:hypothetical protein
MKVWLASFVILFGLIEAYQWLMAVPGLQEFSLPLPILLGSGFALAIAANTNKRVSLPWQDPIYLNLSNAPPQSRAIAPVTNVPVATPLQAASQAVPQSVPQTAETRPSPELPVFDYHLQPRRSISFTIQKPREKQD